jgi:putative transposase
MINQHTGLETARVPKKITQQAIAQGAVPEAIAELQKFIALRSEARKVRKALAVKLVYQGYLYEKIQTILLLRNTFRSIGNRDEF